MNAIPIYAVSDLHLSHDGSKAMDRFGPIWRDHEQVMFRRWSTVVPDHAIVLMPGDHSWASRPQDIAVDFGRIDQLPGRTKLLSPGNHDFGVWPNATRARRATDPFPTLNAIKDTIFRVKRAGLPDLIVVGVRGVETADNPELPAVQRSLRRLTTLLEKVNTQRTSNCSVILMIHYPPFAQLREASPFTDVIESADVDLCVYGHLHDDDSAQVAFEGLRRNTVYRLVSAPWLRMTPTLVADLTSDGLRFGER